LTFGIVSDFDIRIFLDNSCIEFLRQCSRGEPAKLPSGRRSPLMLHYYKIRREE